MKTQNEEIKMASGTDPISLLVDESKRESYDEPPLSVVRVFGTNGGLN
jgi:hypothetical protein